jgi:hypothetical protein
MDKFGVVWAHFAVTADHLSRTNASKSALLKQEQEKP